MGKVIDLSGRKIGDWEVLSRAENNDHGAAMWLCRCKCGTERPVLGSTLKSGDSRSCGCSVIALTAQEKKAFERQTKLEEAAKKVLDDPLSSHDQRQKADRTIRLAPKHRAALEAKVNARKQTVLAEKTAERSANELDRIKALYPETESLPLGEERATLLKNLNALLPGLLTATLSNARFYVLGRIAELEEAVRQESAIIAALRAKDEERQVAIDKSACEKAAAHIHARVNPVLRVNNLNLETRTALQNFCRTMHTNAREYGNTATGLDGSGARRIVVAQYISKAYEELAKRLEPFKPTKTQLATSQTSPEFWDQMLSPEQFNFRDLTERALICYGARASYKNNGMLDKLATVPRIPEPIWPPEGPHQSLEGVIAFANLPLNSSWWRDDQEKEQNEALEKFRLEDPKGYKRLLVKGPEMLEMWLSKNQEERLKLKKKNPIKFRKFKDVEKYLQPIDSSIPTLVYLVPTNTLENPRSRPRMMWPDGREVQFREIFYDQMLKAWVAAPEPADAYWDGGNRKMVWTQDDRGGWVKVAENPEARWEQNMEGHFVRTDGTSSRWAKPVKITFLKGDRHVPGSGRDFFRHGHWWLQSEVDRAETGWSEKPPTILPPLKLTVADSIASVPAYKEDRWEAEKLKRWGPA